MAMFGMMRSTGLRALMAGGLLTVLMVAVAPADVFQNVLVISIDALHPEALRVGNLPTLQRAMRQGVYTMAGQSTDPPLTLIAHAAMFTGVSPNAGGKQDNRWLPGDPTVGRPTIFSRAKSGGYRTGYFYSKQKLGYLVNDAVDAHQWSKDNAIDLAETFMAAPGRHFVFLHVSGLDQVGPENGWLSPEYLEELFYIDDALSPLIAKIEKQKHFLLVITSDHAGHGRIHGSRHPEDYRLPLVIYSDVKAFSDYQDVAYTVTDLHKILDAVW
jgi:predicted AlkP superfamily pyrophosphatase or phosphodiesterase